MRARMSESDLFAKYCALFLEDGLSKKDQAVAFVFYHLKTQDSTGVSLSEISRYFDKANLPAPNETRLGKQLKADKNVIYNSRQKKFRMVRGLLADFDRRFSPLAPESEGGGLHTTMEQQISDFAASRIDIVNIPFLSEEDKQDVRRMAELYMLLFCLENSVRRLIEHVLSKSHGKDWWDQVASASMKRKHETRLENENVNKWLPARSGVGPLYSIDWSDLVTIIRKYEAAFLPFIGSIGFMHRIEDLGQLRHVIAHNGVLRDQRHIERINIYLADWIEQISESLKSKR